ncbi:hypothetical protein GCM10027162_11930 [Streptomyces incanus]
MYEAGGNVEDAVAQGLRGGLGELAVQGEELEPAAEIGGEGGGGEPGGVHLQLARGKQAGPGRFLIADLELKKGIVGRR